ncbi:MAG: hypothetical protein EPGJADBJ_02709 [Saprospiraceae bacterium]|nr:hypothetical protein [Saprospiraceae bacterium]
MVVGVESDQSGRIVVQRVVDAIGTAEVIGLVKIISSDIDGGGAQVFHVVRFAAKRVAARAGHHTTGLDLHVGGIVCGIVKVVVGQGRFAIGLHEYAYVVVVQCVAGHLYWLLRAEIAAGYPLETDVRALNCVVGISDRAGCAGMRGHAEGALEVQRRVVAAGQVQELVVADGDISGMAMAVFPNAEYHLRVGRLSILDIDRIAGDHQSVVDIAAAGIGLHADRSRIVYPIAHAVARDVERIVRDRLVGTEGEVDTDVLVYIGRGNRRVQVGCDIERIVGDRGAVESVGSAGAVEHTDRQVEIQEFHVGDRPVLVVTAVEDQHAFQVDGSEVAGALDRSGSKAFRGGKGDAIEVGRHQNGIVVGSADDAVVAQSPCGRSVGLRPVETAFEIDRPAVSSNKGYGVSDPRIVVVGCRWRGVVRHISVAGFYGHKTER